MVRRKYSKKRMSKIEPAVQTLTFALSLPAGNSNTYVDLSQVASLVNRRFYRQGINWAVAGFKLLTNAGDVGGLTIQKLPNTWVMSNAWEKSFRTWTRMNDAALEENESIKPRFLDFKVFADHAHAVAGRAANLLPISFTGGAAVPGEWQMSRIVVPETTTAIGAVTEFELVATGASNPGAGASGLNSKSLIEGYAASRGLPNVLDPNTPDDAANYGENWMMAIFNEGTLQDATVNDEMITENAIAPYPFENDGVNLDTMYPGGANQLAGLQIHDLENVTSTTIGGTTRFKGGNFPCGLIKFSATNWSQASVVTLLIDLIPGHHRGYLCEPMTEM